MATPPLDVSASVVREFYNRHPFPDFDLGKYALGEDLYRCANSYALLLDSHLPRDASVLDVGCGTGQLSSLLALKGRRVVGLDFSSASIRKGLALRDRLGLENLELREVDAGRARRPAGEERFDFVLVHGVIPCVPEPQRFLTQVTSEFAASRAWLTVGLYNRWGRGVLRLMRRFAHRQGTPGGGVDIAVPPAVDAMLLSETQDPNKVDSWIADQLEPAFERSHTVADVCRWLDACDAQWVKSLPGLPGDPGKSAPLFGGAGGKPPRGVLARLAECFWLVTLRDTGGYFVVVARLPERA